MISRRRFLGGTTLAAAARPSPASAEPPPETTRIRLVRESSICLAPMYVAEELLKAEGFTDVHYIPLERNLGTGEMLGTAKADLGSDAAPALIINLEAG